MIEDVTPEETGKIAGILETKWAQTYADKTRFKAEADSLRTALDVMTADRDYWRHRAEESELERDEARESEEYMHRQWESVGAVAKETLEHRNARRKKPRPQLALTPDDKPPSVVVFNRQPA
jgi:hypothetical protein